MYVDIYDFGGEGSQVYSEQCKCGNVIDISTQKDEGSEYTIYIYV